jgi:hypothetical protein
MGGSEGNGEFRFPSPRTLGKTQRGGKPAPDMPAPRFLFPLLVALAGCASPERQATQAILPGDASAPSQVTPSEALATARIYANHPWQPFARNILHGTDASGIRVDTPDIGYRPPNGRKGWWIPGAVNEGIPYKWGGFDDPASFDAAIAAGRAAGDVSSPAKRMADNAAVSAQAAGVDCSGFVSRCLKLPVVYDSARLPSVCEPLASARDLRAGDLLNIPHRHVILVAGWARPDHSWICYYETGGIPEWKPALKQSPLDKLLALGFQPLRYRGMAREARPSGKEVLTRAVREGAVVVAEPVVGAP